jgi:hypothetical protein
MDEIRARLNRRRQGNERIIRDLLKDPNFKHLSPRFSRNHRRHPRRGRREEGREEGRTDR